MPAYASDVTNTSDMISKHDAAIDAAMAWGGAALMVESPRIASSIRIGADKLGNDPGSPHSKKGFERVFGNAAFEEHAGAPASDAADASPKSPAAPMPKGGPRLSLAPLTVAASGGSASGRSLAASPARTPRGEDGGYGGVGSNGTPRQAFSPNGSLRDRPLTPQASLNGQRSLTPQRSIGRHDTLRNSNAGSPVPEAASPRASAGERRAVSRLFQSHLSRSHKASESMLRDSMQADDETEVVAFSDRLTPENMPARQDDEQQGGRGDAAGAGMTAAVWAARCRSEVLAGHRLDAVVVPGPSGNSLVRCYVKRLKPMFGSTSFHMYLQHGDTFLLSARKRQKSKVSSFVISTDADDLQRSSDACIAKVKANFTGSEYTLWNRGGSPDLKKGFSQEELCIAFSTESKGLAGGPRAMRVAMHAPDSDWRTSTGHGENGEFDSLSSTLALAASKTMPPFVERRISLMTNKLPEYDAASKLYVLDFGQRVKEASVKNFQLVSWDHLNNTCGSKLLLSFGKIDSDTYALDFAYPMSVQSAFAAALACMDSKLVYSM